MPEATGAGFAEDGSEVEPKATSPHAGSEHNATQTMDHRHRDEEHDGLGTVRSA